MTIQKVNEETGGNYRLEDDKYIEGSVAKDTDKNIRVGKSLRFKNIRVEIPNENSYNYIRVDWVRTGVKGEPLFLQTDIEFEEFLNFLKMLIKEIKMKIPKKRISNQYKSEISKKSEIIMP